MTTWFQKQKNYNCTQCASLSITVALIICDTAYRSLFDPARERDYQGNQAAILSSSSGIENLIVLGI